MLARRDAGTCTPRHTLCIQFSAGRAANVVDLERHVGFVFSILSECTMDSDKQLN